MSKHTQAQDNSQVVGMLLVIGGVWALVEEFGRIDLPEIAAFAIMPLIGALFIGKGILTRQAGPIIPGSIVGSLGLAIFVTANPFNWLMFGDMSNGTAFMFIFAAGWLSIVLLTALFSDEWQWWAIIPAIVFALIGATVAYGGIFATLLSLIGKSWPLLLILIGAKSLFTHKDKTTI